MNDSKLIELALKNCGGNVSQFSREAGVSRQVVQHWLRRQRLPSWRRETVRKVAKQ